MLPRHALALALVAICAGGCNGRASSTSQIRIPEPSPGMLEELDAIERSRCCDETLEWMEDVLEARCDQIAERGEDAPPECR